jgi:hypothetical protein
MSTITRTFTVAGVQTAMDSVVLTAGIIRADTRAVVPGAGPGTPFSMATPGVYTLTFTDPALGLNYTYQVTPAYKGVAYPIAQVYTVVGPVAPMADGTASAVESFPQTQEGIAIAIPAEASEQLSDYAAFLATEVEECPAAIQERALRLAAFEFCRDTEIWRESWTIATVGGQYQYDLTPMLSFANSGVHRIRSVRCGVTNVYEGDWEPQRGNWIRFYRPPSMDDAQPLLIDVTLMPSIQCTVYPQWLLKRWHQAIVAGAVARLKSQTKRPWGDADGAKTFGMIWDSQTGLAKAEIIMGGKVSASVNLLGRLA